MILSQPFWGDMVAAAGVGPAPIRYKALNGEVLQKAIRYCLSVEASEAAENIARKMREDSGVSAAMASFHRHLDPQSMGCDLHPERPAAWLHSASRRTLKICKVCAEMMVDHECINQKDLAMSA